LQRENRRLPRAIEDVRIEPAATERLSGVDEPRRHLLGEEAHLAQQVAQVLALEKAQRVLQSGLPVRFEMLRDRLRKLGRPMITRCGPRAKAVSRS